MIGTRKTNPSRGMFISGTSLIWKASGNKRQNKLEVNDWRIGPIGTTQLTDWAKYKGGNEDDPGNYEIPSSIDPTDYPDI